MELKKMIMPLIIIVLVIFAVYQNNEINKMEKKIENLDYANKELSNEVNSAETEGNSYYSEMNELNDTVKKLSEDLLEITAEKETTESKLARKINDYNSLKDIYERRMNGKKLLTHEQYFELSMDLFSMWLQLHINKDVTFKDVYTIYTRHEAQNEWYVLKDTALKLGLEGYEEAVQVDFYYTINETDLGYVKIGTDTTPEDGWILEIEDVSEMFEFEKIDYETYPISYTLYAEIITEEETTKAPLMPFYCVK